MSLSSIVITQTPPREKRFTKVASADHYLKQVTNISDTELVSELKKYNVDVGPITETTRGVYERKLAKLMAEKAKGITMYVYTCICTYVCMYMYVVICMYLCVIYVCMYVCI